MRPQTEAELVEWMAEECSLFFGMHTFDEVPPTWQDAMRNLLREMRAGGFFVVDIGFSVATPSTSLTLR